MPKNNGFAFDNLDSSKNNGDKTIDEGKYAEAIDPFEQEETDVDSSGSNIPLEPEESQESERYTEDFETEKGQEATELSPQPSITDWNEIDNALERSEDDQQQRQYELEAPALDISDEAKTIKYYIEKKSLTLADIITLYQNDDNDTISYDENKAKSLYTYLSKKIHEIYGIEYSIDVIQNYNNAKEILEKLYTQIYKPFIKYINFVQALFTSDQNYRELSEQLQDTISLLNKKKLQYSIVQFNHEYSSIDALLEAKKNIEIKKYIEQFKKNNAPLPNDFLKYENQYTVTSNFEKLFREVKHHMNNKKYENYSFKFDDNLKNTYNTINIELNTKLEQLKQSENEARTKAEQARQKKLAAENLKDKLREEGEKRLEQESLKQQKQLAKKREKDQKKKAEDEQEKQKANELEIKELNRSISHGNEGKKPPQTFNGSLFDSTKKSNQSTIQTLMERARDNLLTGPPLPGPAKDVSMLQPAVSVQSAFPSDPQPLTPATISSPLPKNVDVTTTRNSTGPLTDAKRNSGQSTNARRSHSNTTGTPTHQAQFSRTNSDLNEIPRDQSLATGQFISNMNPDVSQSVNPPAQPLKEATILNGVPTPANKPNPMINPFIGETTPVPTSEPTSQQPPDEENSTNPELVFTRRDLPPRTSTTPTPIEPADNPLLDYVEGSPHTVNGDEIYMHSSVDVRDITPAMQAQVNKLKLKLNKVLQIDISGDVTRFENLRKSVKSAINTFKDRVTKEGLMSEILNDSVINSNGTIPNTIENAITSIEANINSDDENNVSAGLEDLIKIANHVNNILENRRVRDQILQLKPRSKSFTFTPVGLQAINDAQAESKKKEENARREAEERKIKDEEENARREAEERKIKEEEENARREAEERKIKEEEERKIKEEEALKEAEERKKTEISQEKDKNKDNTEDKKIADIQKIINAVSDRNKKTYTKILPPEKLLDYMNIYYPELNLQAILDDFKNTKTNNNKNEIEIRNLKFEGRLLNHFHVCLVILWAIHTRCDKRNNNYIFYNILKWASSDNIQIDYVDDYGGLSIEEYLIEKLQDVKYKSKPTPEDKRNKKSNEKVVHKKNKIYTVYSDTIKSLGNLFTPKSNAEQAVMDFFRKKDKKDTTEKGKYQYDDNKETKNQIITALGRAMVKPKYKLQETEDIVFYVGWRQKTKDTTQFPWIDYYNNIDFSYKRNADIKRFVNIVSLTFSINYKGTAQENINESDKEDATNMNLDSHGENYTIISTVADKDLDFVYVTDNKEFVESPRKIPVINSAQLNKLKDTYEEHCIVVLYALIKWGVDNLNCFSPAHVEALENKKR